MTDHIQEGVLEAAIERAKRKVLPVVIYQEGARRIVGSALVEDDGTISIEISPEECKILNLHSPFKPGSIGFTEEP